MSCRAPASRVIALLDTVRDATSSWHDRAAELDRESAFPSDELQALRAAGALLAPFPLPNGGAGMGTASSGAVPLCRLLALIGRGNLAVGRVFEGHVNAAKLITAYGTDTQASQAAADACRGHLFAIWNTEAFPGLRLEGGVLHGSKLLCSAAGHATRALVTADTSAGTRMLLVKLRPGERVLPGRAALHGMRAATTANMDLTGVEVEPFDLIGGPGDYVRQPEFSAGAWRTSAVTLGGLEALIGELRRQLSGRGRAGAPAQQVRIGQALIALETSRLWVERAGLVAEGEHTGFAAALLPGDVAAYVNLARIAVETACLDVIRLTQRALGLSALVMPNPVERLIRDLTTYLRQPAPDETLAEAAAWFTTRELPL